MNASLFRRWSARSGTARGYTMIEVLMGLAILAVGASGVVALQKVTILGVTEGRNLTAGSAVAAHHLEAVRTDALRWTSEATAGNAPLLNALRTETTGSRWVLPADQAFTGDDLGTADVEARTGSAAAVAYCTHLRSSDLAVDAGAELAANRDQPILVRVEARTFWAKSGRDISAECANVAGITDLLESGTPLVVGSASYEATDFGWVFLATAIRRNDPVAP
jgi:prepilin-type N-terminal cleavage/methylation domain-containing protein